MINRTTLVGRLANEPELRYTANGIAVTSFRLAVNRTFSNRNGEREADFINIITWRKTAEAVANYLSKGSLAGIDGRIQTRSYENQQGQRVYVTEVVAEQVQFLEPKNSQNSEASNPPQQQYGNLNTNRPEQQNNAQVSSQPQNNDPFASGGQPIDINDDDLPF